MANREPLIQRVADHKDKQYAYQWQIEQYHKAMDCGFYFEAFIIDYALLEDRLRQALYDIGLTQTEFDYEVTDSDSERVKAFKDIVKNYRERENLDNRMNIKIIKNIGVKRNIVAAVFQYARNSENENSDDAVKRTLYQALHDEARCDEVLTLLNGRDENDVNCIRGWCGYRDEITHALMNKNVDSLLKEVADKARDGFLFFRKLDNYVGWIENKHIREKLGME